ncbi:MAG TPA: hypothetical protein VFA07_05580 [Chthonomonadaceae bacterium]|nr:hypothetical protein [Chthonomonadaceae bacterium]
MSAEASSHTTPAEQTPFEKFDEFTRRIMSVPKKEIDEKEAEWKKKQAGKKEKPGGK